MKKAVRLLVIAGLLVLTLTLGATAGPGPKVAPPGQIKMHEPGELFCPRAALVFGTIVIQPGRCYVLLILHDARGTFLAFTSPEAKIPPGQLVRLSTPAGAKVRGRIFFLVPIRTTAVLVPADTLSLVAVRVEDSGPKLSIILIGTPSPNVTIVFNVRL
jgi:hypothetical protein